MNKKILIVEDDLLQRQMLETLIRRKLDVPCLSAENGREALNHIEKDKDRAICLVIMDINMPVMGGMETLKIIRTQYPHLPVIVLTGNTSLNDAVEAMKAGAQDFIAKPYQGERIIITITNCLKLSTLSQEVTRLKKEKDGTLGFDQMIGHGSGLAQSVEIGQKAAASDLPVLITGPTGCGKEVFARAIHGDSKRAGRPFIAVNCGAIPAQLVESTLFGHEKGAFTGATDKVPGKFREAEGGTIFLDEVGELPLDAQVKLLRVLQQKEVEPVGAARPVPVNVRVISATNRTLENEVAQGHFREDLFFRLNVLTIELPPLQNRTQDIPALARHFIERYCALEGIPLIHIPDDTILYLQLHDWPGNVRQLENTINRALVMRENDTLRPDDFIQTPITDHGNHNHDMPPGTPLIQNYFQKDGSFKSMETIEREAMEAALDHTRGNITEAAKALGMAKSTFYRKMAQMGIEREEF